MLIQVWLLACAVATSMSQLYVYECPRQFPELYYCEMCYDDMFVGVVCYKCFDGYTPRIFEFWEYRSDTCIACPANCRKCTNWTAPRCTQCYAGYAVSNTVCVFACIAANCRQCSSSNYCSRCLTGFGASQGKCLPCSDGCFQCGYSLSICTACKTGYRLSGSVCFLCPSTCVSCTALSLCTACKVGFGLSSGSCISCVSSVCLQCSANASSCTSCRDGYYLASGTCVSCSSKCLRCNSTACHQCETGLGVSGTNCAPCTQPACLQCLANASWCTKCTAGFVVLARSCVPCTSNCSMCSDSPTNCTGCLLGFGLSSKACISCVDPRCQDCATAASNCSRCADGYAFSADTCTKCIGNCQRCSTSPAVCVDCKEGFWLSGGVCLACMQPFCVSCSAGFAACTSCLPGYRLNKKLCVPCPANCLNCSQSWSLCTNCSWSFGVVNGSCQPCSVLNCLECNSDVSSCFGCLRGFILSGKVCVACSENCAQCLGFQHNCTACLQGFRVSAGQCVPCAVSRCLQCSSDKSCLSCQAGYLLTNQTCAGCQLPDCQLCNAHHSQCVRCSASYGLNSSQLCQTCSDSLCSRCDDDYTKCTACRHGTRFSGEGKCQPCQGGDCFNCTQDNTECKKVEESLEQQYQRVLSQVLPFHIDYAQVMQRLSLATVSAAWIGQLMAVLLSRLIGLQSLIVMQSMERVLLNEPFLQDSRQSLQYLHGYNLKLVAQSPQKKRVLQTQSFSETLFNETELYNKINLSLLFVVVPLIYHVLAYTWLTCVIQGDRTLYDQCFVSEQQTAKSAEFYRSARHYTFSLDLLLQGIIGNMSVLSCSLYSFFAAGLSRGFDVASTIYAAAILLLHFGALANVLYRLPHIGSLNSNFAPGRHTLIPLVLPSLLPVCAYVNVRFNPEMMYISLGLGALLFLYFLVSRPFRECSHNFITALNMLIFCSFVSYAVLKQYLHPTQSNVVILALLLTVNSVLIFPLAALFTFAVLALNFFSQKCRNANRVSEINHPQSLQVYKIIYKDLQNLQRQQPFKHGEDVNPYIVQNLEEMSQSVNDLEGTQKQTKNTGFRANRSENEGASELRRSVQTFNQNWDRSQMTQKTRILKTNRTLKLMAKTERQIQVAGEERYEILEINQKSERKIEATKKQYWLQTPTLNIVRSNYTVRTIGEDSDSSG